MAPSGIQAQLVKYLTDAHSIEEQALVQLRQAPKIAGDERLGAAFRKHLAETEDQERTVRDLLEARDAAPTRLKDLPAKAGGFAFVLFARFQPDTPGKLTAHAYSYEHMELAAYDLIAAVAERAGDEEAAAASRAIREQERTMASRLEGLFNAAVEASLEALDPDDLGEQLNKYLADAHAIEAQSIQLLEKGPRIAGEGRLASALEEHLGESREQQRTLESRLEARGGSPSKLKDVALRTGALNWGAFFAAQPDTPAKLAAFAFAFEHLEIGGYEQLRRVAERAGDPETASAVERILAEERAAASTLHGLFPEALQASLDAQGVATAP